MDDRKSDHIIPSGPVIEDASEALLKSRLRASASSGNVRLSASAPLLPAISSATLSSTASSVALPSSNLSLRPKLPGSSVEASKRSQASLGSTLPAAVRRASLSDGPSAGAAAAMNVRDTPGGAVALRRT